LSRSAQKKKKKKKWRHKDGVSIEATK